MRFLITLVILLSVSGPAFSQGNYDITQAPLPYSDIIKNYPITYTNTTTNVVYRSNPNSDLLKKYGDFDEALYFRKHGTPNMVVRDSIQHVEKENEYNNVLKNKMALNDPINDLIDIAQVKVMMEWLHKNNKILASAYDEEIKDINKKYDNCKKDFPQKLSEFNRTKKTDRADVIWNNINNQVERYLDQIRNGK
ncbi:MAG: hypothetical protein NTY22_02785 [Proteobacteria bacterium]|nr:hypothetical protein [Pseudomonadota bacterium]